MTRQPNNLGGDFRPDGTRRSAKQKPDEPRPLFDLGQTAKQTQTAAAIAAEPKRGKRFEAAEAALIEAGPTGLIRHQLADAIGCPLSSACPVALKLLDNAIAFERGTRLSPYGSPAAVLVHRVFVRGGTA